MPRLEGAEQAVAATQPSKVMPATPTPAAAPHMAVRPVLSLKEQRDLLKENKVVGFHCAECKLDRFSPMLRCPTCKSSNIVRREFSRTGTVISYTIQAVASEAFLNETPFAFALIKLDDGPMVSGWIPWIAKPKDLSSGQKVEYTSSYKPGMMFEKK